VEPEGGRGVGHALMVGAPSGRDNWLPVVAARHCPRRPPRSRLEESIRTAGG
jgi:hypothetical protein